MGSLSPHRLFHDPNLHPPESCGGRAMPHVGHLAGFTFPAIRCPPHLPVALVCNRITRIPELWRNPCVGGVFNHIRKFPVLDLPSYFGPKLKVNPLVIDGPASIGG